MAATPRWARLPKRSWRTMNLRSKYYEQIANQMPVPVLSAHGIVEREGKHEAYPAMLPSPEGRVRQRLNVCPRPREAARAPQ